MNYARQLLEKITERSAIVGIIGLGYVGLPLAREFCAAGFRVLGFDIDSTKVTMLNAGKKETRLPDDNWTVVTRDRSLSAQWEHTILVTDDGHEILTVT